MLTRFFFCFFILLLLAPFFASVSDALEIESFISSDEFVEKTLEEFFRCDTSRSGCLDATQMLLAALHLEQDLRPLLPPQAAKHRQPQMADVESILQMFGGGKHGKMHTAGGQGQGQGQQERAAGTGPAQSLNHLEFLHFSRVLFRNVCAHVKL